MPNKIGYDLESTHFYIHGSNLTNVMSIGSSEKTNTLKIYANNNSNQAYHIGLDATNPPLFWIGRQIGESLSSPYEPVVSPTLYIKNSRVGIQTPDPVCALDVRGDLFITGRLLTNTTGSNNAFESDIISTGAITSTSNAGIDFNNSKIFNIQTANINSDVTLGGVQRHVMNGTQHIQALQSSGLISSTSTSMMYLTLSWNTISTYEMLDPMFQIDLTFFASGENNTRMNIKTTVLVYIPTVQVDIIIDKTSIQSENVVDLQPIFIKQSTNSMRVGVQWQLSSYTKHNGFLKIQALAPTEIGDIYVS